MLYEYMDILFYHFILLKDLVQTKDGFLTFILMFTNKAFHKLSSFEVFSILIRSKTVLNDYTVNSQFNCVESKTIFLSISIDKNIPN